MLLVVWAVAKRPLLFTSMKRLILDGYNHKIYDGEIIGTIVPQNSRWGLTNGYKIIEIDSVQHDGGRDCTDNQGAVL